MFVEVSHHTPMRAVKQNKVSHEAETQLVILHQVCMIIIFNYNERIIYRFLS